ncbi:MAG: ABC transporter permease [Anaerolineae bacterium]|nr:ABC transporter permease [Anaerolineae bacterium]
MLIYVVRRLLIAIPLILLVVIANFLLIALAPGDPVALLVGDFPAPPEYVAQVRADYGLDQPVAVQLWRYLGQVAQGNFGFSFANRMPVLQLIGLRVGATLLLTLTALTFASLVGILLGVIAARRRGTWLDLTSSVAALIGYAIPEFWLGQLLILLFAVGLGWLPSQGFTSPRLEATGFAYARDVAWHLVLPAFALSLRYLALITRMTRAAMLDVLQADYVRTARAKGASERAVLLVHALRNAAAPVITVIGYNLGFVLAGSALVETVYSWPGIGRLLFESIGKRDYPVLTAILFMVSLTIVLANLLTDLVHSWLDPRVRRA